MDNDMIDDLFKTYIRVQEDRMNQLVKRIEVLEADKKQCNDVVIAAIDYIAKQREVIDNGNR